MTVANHGQMPPTFYRIRWSATHVPTSTPQVVDQAYFSGTGPAADPGLTDKTGLIQIADYAFLQSGDYNVCVSVDTDAAATGGYVPEMLETNNTRCQIITVHEPLAELTPWNNWQHGPQPGTVYAILTELK